MNIITIPDCFRDVYSFEKFLLFREKIFKSANPVIDLSNVKFVEPYSLTSLLLMGRKYLRDSGNKIILNNISVPVHQYLARMDFIQQGYFEIGTQIHKEKLFKRSSFSRSVIELTEIPNRETDSINKISSVIALFRERAEYIMKLKFSEKITDDFVTVISELTQNIFEHALDSGYVAIQSYSYQNSKVVRFVISDGGIGIEQSFLENGKNQKEHGAELIEKVLKEPVSSKRDYGYGLCRVASIVGSTGGNIFIRSNNSSAAMVTNEKTGVGQYYFKKNNIPEFSGTQISITLKV